MISMMDVIGQSGTAPAGGIIAGGYRGKPDTELLPELKGSRGARTFREMGDNDATIGNGIGMTMNVVRRVEWKPEVGPSKSARASSEAEFYETVIGDMAHTWDEFMSDVVRGVITFGYSPHEITFKRRLGKVRGPKGESDRLRSSAYDDGRLGIAELALRRQETISEWAFDQHGAVVGCVQALQHGGASVRVIPRVKLALFRSEHNGGSPEGRSMLRNAYRAWYFLKRLEEFEAIGVQRDLTGLPVMRLPLEYLDTRNKDAVKRAAFTNLKTTLQQVSRNEHEGVVFPSKMDPVTGKDTGFDFSLMTSGGARAHNTSEIIARKKHEIAGAFQSAFQQLGSTQASGSRAVSEDHSTMYEVGVHALLDIVEETFHREVTRPLFEMMGVPPEDTPRYAHGDVSREDLDKFVDRICKLADSGFLTLDDDIEDLVREKFHLGERVHSRDDEDDDELDVSAAPDSDEDEEVLDGEPGAVGKVGAWVPPKGVQRAAAEALAAHKAAGRMRKGLSGPMLSRARVLASGQPVSIATLKRLASALSLSQPDRKAKGWRDRGPDWQQWHAMGGDQGKRWAEAVLAARAA